MSKTTDAVEILRKRYPHDWTKPHVLDEGWTYCMNCGEFAFVQKLQDVEVMERNGKVYLVPTVHHFCWECLNDYEIYQEGDYDSLVALYQLEARETFFYHFSKILDMDPRTGGLQ